MAEHDYVIANQNGANTRSDLNNALAAIVSNNSKATAPTTTYAYMWWADTANDILKQRNAADSAWINILTLSTGAPLGALAASLVSGTHTNFTSTGIDDNATSTAITIDASENVEINTGNLVIGTSGKGIDFSATSDGSGTMTSEVLDDYEEGTFTPTYSLGFTGITYSAQQGRYTKTGDVVNYTIALTMSAATASANHVRISGLPFTSDATDGYGGAYLGYSPFIDAATVSRFVMHTPVNDTRVLFYTNTSQLLGTDAGIAPTGALLIIGSYFAA